MCCLSVSCGIFHDQAAARLYLWAVTNILAAAAIVAAAVEAVAAATAWTVRRRRCSQLPPTVEAVAY